MHRISFAAFVLFLIAATNLVADEKSRHDEPVRLTPGRNVKDQILKEIDPFGNDVKAKLGPKMLAHQPYIGVDGAFATTLKATTVEQVVDRLLARLKTRPTMTTKNSCLAFWLSVGERLPAVAIFSLRPSASGDLLGQALLP